MQDVRGETEGDTAAMTAAVETPAGELQAEIQSPLQQLKSECPHTPVVVQPSSSPIMVQPSPPAVVVQPSPPAVVVQPSPPPIMVQPSPPAVVVQPSPPAVVVQPSPPAVVVQPSPPAVVVQPSPPAVVVQPSPPAVVVQPSLISKMVPPSPPAVVVHAFPTSEVVQPSPPAAVQLSPQVTAEASLSYDPSILEYKKQVSSLPPALALSEEGVTTTAAQASQSSDPLQVNVPVRHNGTVTVSHEKARSPPDSPSNPSLGPPVGQSSQDAPTRSSSRQNPSPLSHNTLPRPTVLQDPQMRHPHHQGSALGRPMLHATSMGPPMHLPPMAPPPRQFSRMGHRPSFQGHMVVMPPHQVSPARPQLPQRPMVSPPGLQRYQSPLAGPSSQEPSEISSSHYQHEEPAGEGPAFQEEDAAYQEGAGYQGEGATGYLGQVRPTRRQPGTLRISKWVNPIPPDPDDGQQQVGEQELATKMLQIQSKRFYIDVKQNRRGRFMKVAEIGADGRRNQVFLALSTAAEFRDHLSLFSDFYANLGPPNPDTLPEDGKLKSETMVKDNRRYYLDLKENSRGRFLRVSQTIARGGPRCQIAIPAQGMIEFRDALQELLDEFGTDDGGYKGELPEGRHMRVENKNFYFDIGQNNRGIYMRISEVKTNFRTAITIPEKSWSRFRDIFADYVDKMKDGGEKGPSESNK